MTPFAPEAYLTQVSTGLRFALGNGQSWAIGRGDGCPILLESRSVSRLHALIQRRSEGRFQLVDLGSRNGSFLNSRRVTVPAELTDHDRLVFGDQELLFQSLGAPAAATAGGEADARNAPTTALHENRLATILVVDIRDFTPLARSVSESLLSQTIGTWFLRAGSVAQRLGSWAQKYIGDAVMAVWVHDDLTRVRLDIVAVLAAAAEIEAATGEISRALPLPHPLRIGAGVNTGPSILGGADYTALGDAVNTAFRLQAATKNLGLEMLVGDTAYRELNTCGAGAFRRHELALKGYESLSTAWAIAFDDLRRFLAESRG